MMATTSAPTNFQSTFAAKRSITHLTGFIKAQEELTRKNLMLGGSECYLVPVAGDAMMSALLESMTNEANVEVKTLTFVKPGDTQEVQFDKSFLNGDAGRGLTVPSIDASEYVFVGFSYKRGEHFYLVKSYI